MNRVQCVFVVALVALAASVGAGQETGADRLTADTLKGVEFRSLGPVLTTGRVADIDVDPNNPDVYYVAAAVGGVWKSENRGDTWTPVFDSGGAFNMCCVVVDPRNSNVVWVGTGENSNPRSSTYGDGVYKSTDGGKTWTRVGLQKSEHIGNLKIDPRNSDVVYVASQGPLWSPGGDRGVYKTTDGGKTWKAVLTVSADTGANEVAIDPNNPDVVYASMWQRRRGVGQMIGGGPESGIFKSANGGATWTKLAKGLPPGNLGRIALGVDPRAKPTRVYALINALAPDSGFYRSDDAGVTWQRMGAPYGKNASPASAPEPAAGGQTGGGSGGPVGGGAGRGGGRGGCSPGAYCGGDPGYYQEIVVDPIRPDTIWSVNTNLERSDDGGKSFKPVTQLGMRMNGVHVDFHDVWPDPKDRNHVLVANDGGLYETFDEGKNWRHFDNLPVTQFYRVAVDNAKPFYHVCGGAQDNESQCGPSRTINRVGIRTSDWWMIGGCDGFQPRIDPDDPNIVYTTCQSGGISRLDLRTGENKSIRPGGGRGGVVSPPDANDPNAQAAIAAGVVGSAGGQGGAISAQGAPAAQGAAQGRGGRGGAAGERTNWDAPYIISPHSSTRLYWGSSRLYRSDDRGDHWTAISPDLSRQLDPALIPIMGKVWDPATTVAYNNATTPLSNIVSLDESPLMEGLIYVGTDDGLLQVTEDGGKTWRKTEQFASTPTGVYVTDVFASPRDANVVFVALNNWQRGDFKPYVLRSDDRGKTFKSIASDLPDRQDVFAILQDHVNGNLLFAGTEFGLFLTVDGGAHWVQLKGGLPTIQVRDLTVQKRENDLVLGTFGRGLYILDDYSPLRELTAQSLAQEAELYPLRNAYEFSELGYPQAAWGNVTTPNPANGAVFTFSVASGFSGSLVLTIADETGKQVRRLTLPTEAGVHRVAWNLRGEPVSGAGGGRGGRGGGAGAAAQGTPSPQAAAGVGASAPGAAAQGAATGAQGGPAGGGAAGAPPVGGAAAAGAGFGGRGTPQGPLVDHGRFTATLGRLVGDQVTPIGKPQSFLVVPLPEKNY